MADIQRQFEEFHATIRVDFDMADELRDKRDIVLARIRKHLADNERPSFRELMQGSYKMKTGVRPVGDLEYDIDIGLRFDIRETDHTATDVRSWVLDALKGHTNTVEHRGPCIRVIYQKGFHLDLVIYAVWKDAAGVQQHRLAHKTRGWRAADPAALLDLVDRHRQDHFADTEDDETKTDQFRRCVRSLRRWIDVQIPRETDAKPTGLAFVLLAMQRGLQRTTFLDGRSDDRQALARFARALAQSAGRLTAKKPTPEFEDVLARLSDAEMDAFKAKLLVLADALDYAGKTADPVAACERLVTVFGDDFPVPEPEDTATRTRAPAIVTSSSSA